MAYQVAIERSAEKDFRKLVPPWDKNVKRVLLDLEHNPRPHGYIKLSGSKDEYRVRVGDYRILFTIDEVHKRVTIFRIRHRGEVYR